jgi:uroporphyrinogen decarboxylase
VNVDRMTAKERIKCLLLNKTVDRVPFMPFFVGYLAISSGISLYDFYTKPDLAFQAGEEGMKKFPWANIRPVYGWADHGAWEFGGKIAWPKGNKAMTPYTPEPLISKPKEVDQIPEPDPLETDWFHLRTCFNEICIQKGFSAHLPSGSIMAQLGSILGAENLMKWMMKHPDAIHQLAKKILHFNIKMAGITLEKYGARHCSVMTDLTLESNSVISPKAFEEFCLPYIIKLHGFYYESGVRAIMIHLCGDHKGNLKHWKKVPLPERAIFSIGDAMDLEKISDFLGEKYILAGNISTTTLQFGTKKDVKEEVKRCLNQAKDRSGGFILMPACEYPPMAPRENLEAIREALVEHGFY